MGGMYVTYGRLGRIPSIEIGSRERGRIVSVYGSGNRPVHKEVLDNAMECLAHARKIAQIHWVSDPAGTGGRPASQTMASGKND